MTKSLLLLPLFASLAACSGNSASGAPASGANAKGAAVAVATPRNDATVAAQTVIQATMRDSLSSRTNKPDETVHATVAADVKDGAGRVVIPSGAPLTLKIVKLEPGSDQVRPEGRLELVATSVTVNGKAMPLHGTLGAIPHHMKGRGVTRDEAGRVAAGTAVGALIGQAIGKNTKGTVIGGAVGAVAGGAVAAKYAYRDVIVDPGAHFTITITQPLVVAN